MAVLNKIRQRSVFLIIIIALALFAFVLSDIIRNGGFTSSNTQNTVGAVNGEDIDRQEFMMQVESYQRNSQQQITNIQAVKDVWNAKVQEVVLAQQMEELGIDVGEGQINLILEQQLANNPNFADEDGFFSFQAVREYVANIRSTSPEAYNQWLNYENSVAQMAKENVYFDMIKAGIGATLIEGRNTYRLENSTIDIQYVQIPYTSVGDVEISDNAIADYIKKHPETYKTDASRDIQYVLFEEKPSEEDENEVKSSLSELMDDRVQFNSQTNSNDTVYGFRNTRTPAEFVNINSDVPFQDRFYFKNNVPENIADEIFALEEGEIYGPYKNNTTWNLTKVIEIEQIPDSAKASHILISWQGLQTASGTERTKEEAKILTDSLLSEVRNNTEKFTEIAAEYSADNSNKNSGGQLDWFTYGRMVKPFNDYVFSHNKGDMGIVETDFGYHIISVEEVTEEEKAVKLATISRMVEPSETTINNLFTEATSFQLATEDQGFNDAATAKNLQARPVRGIKRLDENLPGIGAKRNIVQWTFEKGTALGAIKRFDVNNGYVIVQLTGKTSEGTMSVEDATATVAPILKKQKQAEMIKNKISGTDLATIAQNNGAQVRNANGISLGTPMISGAGNEPQVVGAAFSLETGGTARPVAGEKGVYVVKLINKTAAPELASYAGIATQESQERTSTIGQPNGPVVGALKEAAEIEDNRTTFY